MAAHSTEDRPVIVGAGPGGVAAALFLARAGIPSLLLERATFPRDKVCGDALSGKVLEVLRKLDPSYAEALHQSAVGLPSWGIRFAAPSGEALQVPFKNDYDPGKQRPPGYIARRLSFDAWWAEQARAEPLIELRENAGVTDAAEADGGVRLSLKDGSTLWSPLALAADGANSTLARRLAHRSVEPRHHCAGIRAYYQGVQGLQADGFIELHFLKHVKPGYLWIFPLPDGAANVGLGIRSDVLKRRGYNLKALLPELLAQPPFAQRFAHATLEGPIQGLGLPLGSRKRPLSGPGWLLLGDAGSLIDPFTGEGIGNALICGRLAGEHIATLWGKQPRFSQTDLAPYDAAVYRRLGPELNISTRLQQLAQYPALFNFVIRRANRSRALRETITAMFEDLDLRARFRDPRFYLAMLRS